MTINAVTRASPAQFLEMKTIIAEGSLTTITKANPGRELFRKSKPGSFTLKHGTWANTFQFHLPKILSALQPDG